MRHKFKKKIRPFDPTKPLSKSSSYDAELGERARREFPLDPKSKPRRRGRGAGETVAVGDAWDAWVWHPEARVGNEKKKGFVGPPKGDWLTHGASVYNLPNKFGKRNQILKHPEHKTYYKTVLGELGQRRAIIYDEETNRQYSKPAWWMGNFGNKK